MTPSSTGFLIGFKATLLVSVFALSACAKQSQTTTTPESVRLDALEQTVRQQQSDWLLIKPELERILALEADLKRLVDALDVESLVTNETQPADEIIPVPEQEQDAVVETNDETIPAMAEASSTRQMPETPAKEDRDDYVRAVFKPRVSTISSVPTKDSASVAPFAIQLAAYAKQSQLTQGWQRLQTTFADIFQGKIPLQSELQQQNKRLFLLKIGPYTTHSQANTQCQQLKQQKQDCFVVPYIGTPL